MALTVDEIRLGEADFAKCPPQVIVEPSNLPIHSSRKYIDYLDENQIELTTFTIFSLQMADRIGTRLIGMWIALVIIASALLGVGMGCHSNWRVGCPDTHYRETKTSTGDKASNDSTWPDPSGSTNASAAASGGAEGAPRGPTGSTSQLGGTEIAEVQREQLDDTWFNLPYFQASIILWAFILAFSRWMIEKRQSSMSELFERKKEVNLLLLKDEKGVFQPLVSEALRGDERPQRDTREFIKGDDVRTLLEQAKTWEEDPALAETEDSQAPSGSIGRFLRDVLLDTPVKTEDSSANADFLRKMFVYIELDNFELAFNRYVAGLLDPEQMFRASEIIESRCMNSTFRYLAANQGLKYYTDNFHKALIPVLVRTEYLARRRDAILARDAAETAAGA